MKGGAAARSQRRRGSVAVEFALVCIQLCLLLFAAVELGRLVLVYTSVSNAARVGIRYAIVHGSSNSGSGASGPNGPGNTTEIVNTVKAYARTGILDPAQLSVTVTYPDANMNSPRSRVAITVTYPYDPFVILPLNVNLGTTTQGVITF